MEKAPSFQWYPKDCDTDENVRAMDDREFGFYIRCLNHSWLNGGLPADLGEVARILGRNKPYVQKIWTRVGRCFVLEGSRWINEKQEMQRRTARDFVESRRAASQARWDKHAQSKTDARALHVESSPSASPTASASATTTNAPPPLEMPRHSDYPKTDAAVRRRFPAADLPIVIRIVEAATQAYIAVDQPKIPEPTDADFAEAVEQASSESRKQDSAALYLRTVPAVVKSWAELGRQPPAEKLATVDRALLALQQRNDAIKREGIR